MSVNMNRVISTLMGYVSPALFASSIPIGAVFGWQDGHIPINKWFVPFMVAGTALAITGLLVAPEFEMFQMLIISAYLVTCVVYGLEVLLSLVDVERSLALRIIFAPLGQRARQSMHEFHERCARMASEKADKERLWIFLANMEQTNREVFGPRSTERNRRREGAHRAGITSWLDGSSDDDESKDGKVRAHLARHLGACKLRSEGDEETAAHLVECAKESIPLHTFPELWIASCRWRARMMWHLSLIAVAVVAFLGLWYALEWRNRTEPFRAEVYDIHKSADSATSFYILVVHVICYSLGRIVKFIMVYLGERQHRSDLEAAQYYVPHAKYEVADDTADFGRRRVRKHRHWQERKRAYRIHTRAAKREVRQMGFGDTLACFLVTVSFLFDNILQLGAILVLSVEPAYLTYQIPFLFGFGVPVLLDLIPFAQELRGIAAGVQQPGGWSDAWSYHSLLVWHHWSFATRDDGEKARADKLHKHVQELPEAQSRRENDLSEGKWLTPRHDYPTPEEVRRRRNVFVRGCLCIGHWLWPQAEEERMWRHTLETELVQSWLMSRGWRQLEDVYIGACESIANARRAKRAPVDNQWLAHHDEESKHYRTLSMCHRILVSWHESEAHRATAPPLDFLDGMQERLYVLSSESKQHEKNASS